MIQTAPPNSTIFSRPFFISKGLAALAIGAALLQPLSTQAQINSVFIDPPYALDNTVVGIEGWEMVNKESAKVYFDPMGAAVIQSPVVSAAQPSTLHLATMLKNETSLANVGDRFVIETRFALTFDPFHKGGSTGGPYFRLGPSEKAAPFQFGFDYGQGGGLYYQGQDEKRVIFLPREQIEQNIHYEFVIHVDLAERTFRVVVTCPENESFRYESEKVRFQEASNATAAENLKGFYMGNNKPQWVECYVDYLKVISESEGSTPE